MIRNIIFFAIILGFIFCCKNQDPYQGEYIELSFEEMLTFGQPDSLSESTVNYAREVRLGPGGRIYVADAGVSKIKVYSSEGNLVSSFGKRGRGPGEITDIQGFAVTDSTVLTWDQNMQRISIFGLNGKLKTVKNLKGSPFPMHIYPLENSYLALHEENKNLDKYNTVRLGHIYSADFSTPQANFLRVENINENIEKISEILGGWYGSLHIVTNQEFIFVPFIYGGKIYKYAKTNNGWQQVDTYDGLNRQTPFSLMEETNGKRKPDAAISSIYRSEDISFIGHNWSRGLFKYDGYIFHFVFTDIKEKRVFGVELYNEDMNPIGFTPIKSIPITNQEDNALVWGVEDVDKNGNFYFLQRNDEGMQVRVMQVNHEDLERLVQ
ncbi:6-bladed beta-propeller [Fodinibius halophilus]|uniref:6-bladed beta-propeller n=1 Tax=Fodinibius halophilus TaxID=1736908 RepID=A0A6M1T5M8_9BACT|nr:6-bladed beta-propeller [Fodinibius halophilus]NGP87291.1 6-bladed beta-propeller [Fodinibius halophilus]